MSRPVVSVLTPLMKKRAAAKLGVGARRVDQAADRLGRGRACRIALDILGEDDPVVDIDPIGVDRRQGLKPGPSLGSATGDNQFLDLVDGFGGLNSVGQERSRRDGCEESRAIKQDGSR